MRLSLIVFLLSVTCNLYAQLLTGTVKDTAGKPLSFATILVKGTSQGVTANSEGRYALHLEAGNHTLICEHVGYTRLEKTITVNGKDTLDFRLETQQLHLNDIVIHSGDEDPAYGIIRHTIHERETHRKELEQFSCTVYSKGQAVLNSAPTKILGKRMTLDTSYVGRNNFLYLSETVARYAEAPPDKQKVEVLSSKVSGQRNAYGATIPYIVSFYTNVIELGNMNPRGFISPISDNALHYYRYKLEGTFFEGGRMIDKIRVTPRRLFEPCFAGYISIVHDEWRIHSTDLYLTRTAQLEILDTFHIEQIYTPTESQEPIAGLPAAESHLPTIGAAAPTPAESQPWIIRSQVGDFSFKLFGFDVQGGFANTYSDFDTHPVFPKGYFGNTALKYDKGSNKRPEAYWDTVRPVPLSAKELADYHKKDSLEKIQDSPRYKDSIDRINNRITPVGLLLTGVNVQREKRKESYTFSSLVSGVGFNTVEGWYLHENINYRKGFGEQQSLELNPDARYGFSNRHFNAALGARYNFSNKHQTALELGGGKTTFQYDNGNPIPPELNTLYTLLGVRNYEKIYEASFGRVRLVKELGKSGLTLSAGGEFQDRRSLMNTDTGTYWVKANGRAFTPNFPTALTDVDMPSNRASSVTLSVAYQPGVHYIEYPEQVIPLASKYPIFRFSYTKGISGLWGSTADYDKWRFSIQDNVNLKIGGLFKFNVVAGGFLNNRQVALPDYNQINGDQTFLAAGYLGHFQLAPYYQYSNTDHFYTAGFVEHHFNGLLTNKIPLFRRLSWYLVAGVNTLYLSDGRTYTEAFAGLENILKVIRVDYIQGFPGDGPRLSGVRLGFTFGGRPPGQ
jgi:hypothetical protein